MLIWPLPALLTWFAAWGLFLGLPALGVAGLLAFLIAAALGCGAALLARRQTLWRQGFIALGFPLSLLALGGAGLPGWVWLLPLGGLLLLYPLRSWRDAPLFPTPESALQGLARAAPLPAEAWLLEAGCGLGDGLRALRAEYPQARLLGLEWSWPLRLLCDWRCRRAGLHAQVKRADIWAWDWSAHQLVYLFQRPESMLRAVAKAERELQPGAWLISLEFEAAELAPKARLESVAGKPVWLYQAPFKRR